MPDLHVPWQMIVGFGAVAFGVIFVMLYGLKKLAKDDVKPCDKLAGCGGSPHPKIVPLVQDKGLNLSSHQINPDKQR